MKKGKLILGAATFIISAAGVFAFKTHGKYAIKGGPVYASNSQLCTLTTCKTLNLGGTKPQFCHTVNGPGTNLAQTVGGVMFKDAACQQSISHWTVNQ